MASNLENKLKKYAVCAAANVKRAPDGNSFDVYPAHGPDDDQPTFTVTTLHLSCQSDTYCGRSCKYGGIIIYGHNSKGDWRTANGTHCKSGYVVILQTDTSSFKELQKKWPKEPGQVHGVIYRKAFGESCNDVNVVGEGFGLMDGVFTTNSGALNPAHGDCYHDFSSLMHKDSARFVEALVKIWKEAGPRFPNRQNYTVKAESVVYVKPYPPED